MAPETRKNVRSRTRSSQKASLVRIERTLLDMKDNLNDSMKKMDDLDRVVTDLDEIKQQLKSSKRRRRSKKRESSNDASLPDVLGNADMGKIAGLLQDPAIQSLLKNNNLSSLLGNGGSGGSSVPSKKGPDLSDILTVMQNPMVQQMIKRFMA